MSILSCVSGKHHVSQIGAVGASENVRAGSEPDLFFEAVAFGINRGKAISFE